MTGPNADDYLGYSGPGGPVETCGPGRRLLQANHPPEMPLTTPTMPHNPPPRYVLQALAARVVVLPALLIHHSTPYATMNPRLQKRIRKPQ